MGTGGYQRLGDISEHVGPAAALVLADLLLHVRGEVLLLERGAAEHVLQVGLVLGAAVRRELVDDRLLAPLQLRAQLRVGEPEG